MCTLEKSYNTNSWNLDLQRRGAFNNNVPLLDEEEFTASCISEKDKALHHLFHTIHSDEPESESSINDKTFTHLNNNALNKIIDEEIARKPITDIKLHYEKSLSLGLGHQTGCEFVQAVTKRALPAPKANIRNAIIEKTSEHSHAISKLLFQYYEKASVQHIPQNDKGFIETFFGPEEVKIGVESDLNFQPAKKRPRLALEKDTSKHELNVQITIIKDKLKKLRDQHLVAFNQVSDFLIAEGQYFLTTEEQEDLIEEIYILFTNRQKLYFNQDQSLTRAALYLDAIEQVEGMVLETKTAVMQFKQKINEDTGGKLIIWIEEQKKAVEEILKAEDLPEAVTQKATKVITDCKTTIEFIDKLVQPKDEPLMKGRANITVHGDLIQKVDINNSPGSNVAQGVVQYGNITQKTYVQQAQASHDLMKGSSSLLGIIRDALGAGAVAGISGLVLGGIPTMLSSGIAAATDALVRPLATQTARQFGLSENASFILGLTTSAGMSTYTASRITGILSSGAATPVETAPQNTAPSVQTTPNPTPVKTETTPKPTQVNRPVDEPIITMAEKPSVASRIQALMTERQPSSWW